MSCWEIYSKKTHKTEAVIIILFTKNSFSWKQYNINKTLHLQIIILLDEGVSSRFAPHCNLKNYIRNSVFSFWIGNWSYYLISDSTYLLAYWLTHSLKGAESFLRSELLLGYWRNSLHPVASFYGKELLAPCPIPKLEHHLLSAIADSIQGPPKKCIHTLMKENSTLYNRLL